MSFSSITQQIALATAKVRFMSKFFSFFLFLIALLSFFSSCSRFSAEKAIPLIVTKNNTLLLSSAGAVNRVVSSESLGDTLYYLGKISAFTTQQKINNLIYDEPWLEVINSKNQRGWVYAGFVKFDAMQDALLTEKVLERRIKTIFGKHLANRIAKHNLRYSQIGSEADFAKTYWAAKELRDSIELALARRILPDSLSMPDMYWLGGMLHGFVPQLSNDHRFYRIFFDFQAWETIATTSKGKNDDAFMALRRSEYADDGIEYLHKSWAISIEENSDNVASLLGDGKHFEILKAANDALLRGSLFKADILSIKAQIIDDITESPTYWQTQEEMLNEIDNILNADLSALFTQEDIIALKKRREQFINYKMNNIRVDLRAGA